MNILHYTLGFNPNRTGGLVKYATDLMLKQSASGENVFALYPGNFNPFVKTKIKIGNQDQINSYQIINSLPLAIFGGIKKPKDFMKPTNENMYFDFLKRIKPDVIHVHTLMGIHREFFKVANDLRIPIVYTSHDYYGLAPEPNFFLMGKSYDNENTVENWLKASSNALDTWQLRLFQIRYYSLLKNLFKKFRKTNSVHQLSNPSVMIGSVTYEQEYQMSQLKKYYLEIFYKMDFIHFNSSVAEEVFKKNFTKKFQSNIISITNSDIKISKNKKNNSSKTRIAYIGPDRDFKGFYEFLKLPELMDVKKYEFYTYGYLPSTQIDDVKQCGIFNSSDLKSIFDHIDVLVVPSLWKETFGLIVLEALSHGTIPLISENVGSKDLVLKDFLFKRVNQVPEILRNTLAFPDIHIKTMDEHEIEINNLYRKVIFNGQRIDNKETFGKA